MTTIPIRSLITLFGTLLIICVAGLGQQSPNADHPSQGVQLFFSTTEKTGSPYHFAPEAVTVFDNGSPQTSVGVKRAEDLPLVLGILQDESLKNRASSGVPTSAEEDRTISNFLKTSIRAQDTSVWIKFAAGSPNLAGLVSFSDQAGMQEAVNAGRSQRAGTELLQVIDSFQSRAACTECRKTVIVIANGGTFLGPDMYKRIEETALREKIVVHVVDAYLGAGRYGPKGPSEAALPKSSLPAQVVTLVGSIKQSLSDLAAGTGGLYIQATGNDAMRNALSRLQEHLENQYVITYFWSGPQPQRQFHSVRIQSASSAITIHAPKGYYISSE